MHFTSDKVTIADSTNFADSIPLFHQHTLAPMLEAATLLVQAYCDEQEGLQIVGYYHGNEVLDDFEVHPVANKIANKIQVNTGDTDRSSWHFTLLIHGYVLRMTMTCLV